MRYYDDYENERNFEKFARKKKSKHKKGHQSKHGSRFDSLGLYDDDTLDFPATNNPHYTTPSYTPKDVVEEKTKPINKFPEQNNITFGPNTREIQGVKIDYDRVIDIRKVENMKDQTMTYGIKYFFAGEKGLYRIVWFNVKSKVRDSVFNTEYKYWNNLKTNKEEK